MSDDRSSPLTRLFEAERQFYDRLPGRAIYSKLFVRSLLWFAFFSLVYTIVTGL